MGNNKQLDSAIYCSERMLKDAQEGNWDSVMEIEIQRSELLAKLFSTSGNNNIDDMDDKIRKIININKQLEDITVDAKEAAGKQISSINNGRRAVNVYAQNSN